MRELNIAYGNSCKAKFWANKTVSWTDLCERLGNTIRTTETVEEYRVMSKPEKQDAKDRGGFVLGHLRDNRRLVQNIESRSALSQDLDSAKGEFLEKFKRDNRYAVCLYSTHGHTPEAPRYRILIPLTRDVTPDEYSALSRLFAAELGIDQVDECSFKPNQLMYWPTTPANGEFVSYVNEGPWLDPDEWFAKYPNWRDCSLLPTTSRESKVSKRCKKKQQDPLKKDGLVGAFCRTYSIRDVIEKYLSDVYRPSLVEGRYDYIHGEGCAGLVVYDDKFAYSHHATDPAYGKLLNAFDLVRVHLYGDADEKGSYSDMCKLAEKDENVRLQIFHDKQEKAGEDFPEYQDDAWAKGLKYDDKTNQLENCLHNVKLIMQNDPYMKNIVFNQLADGMEIKGEVPWQHQSKFWRDADDAQLICYVDENYGTFSARNYDIAVTKVVDDRSYHPIRQYFDALPEWDGIRRVDTLLIDYLGAEDTPYVRAVTRKELCAAYVRVHNPGMKFDTMIVLNGDQGIGKSTFIEKLGMEWYSDSLNLSDMNDKTAAEKLQGYWILEIGELAGMKKADLDKVKAFISRKDDKYRASFGHRVTPHPRQCVFFGTTNSENGYLRDITGNRRYWNVKVHGNGKYTPWDLSQETVDQIWAEVAILAEAGEELYLPLELEAYAKEEQRKAMERDDREGLVREYLDMLLPKDWSDMDPYRRRDYVRDYDDLTRENGTEVRTAVSNMEIWCECFGKPKEDMKASDSYAISAIMAVFSDWEKPTGSVRIPFYGKQRIYRRKA